MTNDRLITDLYPSLQPLCRSFLVNCQNAGIHAIITETYRSSADQDADYAHGRTSPGSIITNAKGGESPHNCILPNGSPGSKAFDFAIIGPDGFLDWNATDPAWQQAIKIGEALGLISGSTWHSIKDYPHMEMPNWQQQTISSLPTISKTDTIPIDTTQTKGVRMPLTSWKTLLASAATVAVGISESTGYTTWVAQHPGPVTIGLGMLFGFLRLITNTPAGISLSLNSKPTAPITPPTT